MKEQSKDIERRFVEAYDQYADPLFRYCYFKLSNRNRAEELVEETFLKAWQYLVAGEEIDNLRALLYRILNNLIIDDYRRKKTVSLEALEAEGLEFGSEHGSLRLSAEDQSELERILSLIDRLDDKYRQVVLLRYVDDFAVKEIAELLGESENTISVRINRAIKQLKTILRT